MSYRGGEYGHGGYHQDMPVAQLGDMIDPEEFPKVAQHLQSLHNSHPGSSSGSTGYPEDAARHIYVDSATGSHYYTNETPNSIAPYSGYGYIQAPESSSSAPHAFAGAMRTPVNASFNHGMGYFDAGWPTAPNLPLPPTPIQSIPFPLNTPYTSPIHNKRYSTMTTPSTPTSYGRPFPALGNGTPQSTTSAYPPPTTLSLPPPSPAVSSSTSSSTKQSVFQPTRRFSYDDGGHSTQYLTNVSKKYQDFMQSFSNGIEGRDRYEPSQDSDYEPRGRRPTYYRQSMEGYITPGANVPRTSTKTPGPGGELSTRRGTIAAIHQPRPPNSRHSSSESGDAEPTYRPSGRYDDYNGNPRPKGKSRPNSFSYPRPTDSEPSFSARYPFSPDMDPRSSTGSLGNRYNPPAVVHQPGDRYYKPYESPSGPAIVNPGGRVGRYYIQPSQPIENFYYPAIPDERERPSFDAQRQRARSKSRFRARTPAPEERTSASEEEKYRAGLIRSRPSSPTSSQPRGKSRRRRDSPSPGAYRAKSRMRSKSRPRPEIIQSTRPPHGDLPARPGTPGSARPKTPMPGSSGMDAEAMFRMESERQEMEYERSRQEAEREKARLEKERAIQEIYESMERVNLDQDSQSRGSGRESYGFQEQQQQQQHQHQRHKSRARSRHRDHHSRSTSNERSERDSQKDGRRRERERQRDSESEREKERNKAEEYEKEFNRDREREKERERRERAREETLSRLKSEAAAPKVTDPALANPMVENINPLGRNNRERAGVQPGQTFIRPDLLCAMRSLKLCVVEHDPSDDHAHNQLLRLDCGHGYHEDCLRSAVSSRERVPLAQVDLEADKLWCERCRGIFGKKAGR
ncbi:hypothetical protein TWF173_001287 [Orbilia oligospora]|nr:hypothetical protein TWF173_001287 [Orbilia oligospora]